MKELIKEIRSIIETARTNAVRSVDFCRVQMYWQIGRRIVEEEQGGKERAEYGKGLIKNLAKELEPEFGSGFGKRQLDYSKKFYLEFPIVHTLSAQLNWSQYKWLLDIADKDKREYYILESINNSWTARQMKRQIDSMLYELMSVRYASLPIFGAQFHTESVITHCGERMLKNFIALSTSVIRV